MTEEHQKKIFNEWLNHYKALFFKIIRVYTATPMDREDLFQEIIIQVWKSVPQFKEECAVSTWLYRISLNTALKWKSREQKAGQFSNSLDETHHLLIKEETPHDRVEALYVAIRNLKETDRSLALLLLDGLSYREMSLVMGITESNIGVRINRIKKQLTESFKKL
ncbi:MAG: sigma-70 family RNA polymerase sigma factor [Sphingobacteriales bacterium]|nr:MAG: sigma-70 family RNA polymerase sigma factor [Sphingobacteriales bacterium]